MLQKVNFCCGIEVWKKIVKFARRRLFLKTQRLDLGSIYYSFMAVRIYSRAFHFGHAPKWASFATAKMIAQMNVSVQWPCPFLTIFNEKNPCSRLPVVATWEKHLVRRIISITIEEHFQRLGALKCLKSKLIAKWQERLLILFSLSRICIFLDSDGWNCLLFFFHWTIDNNSQTISANWAYHQNWHMWT